MTSEGECHRVGPQNKYKQMWQNQTAPQPAQAKAGQPRPRLTTAFERFQQATQQAQAKPASRPRLTTAFERFQQATQQAAPGQSKQATQKRRLITAFERFQQATQQQASQQPPQASQTAFQRYQESVRKGRLRDGSSSVGATMPPYRYMSTHARRQQSVLFRWLIAKRYYFPVKTAFGTANKTISHTFMDGGIACVPPSDTDDFNTHYVETIEQGDVDLYVSEYGTPCFRGFFDIDMVREDGVVVSAKTFVDLARHIQRVIRKCYEADVAKHQREARVLRDFRVILLGTGSRQKNKRVGDTVKVCMKSAAHLVFPSLMWDAKTARNIWAVVVDYLQTHCQSWQCDWEEVIDKDVYRDPHLRMPYSKKRGPCLCMRKDETCRRCRGGRYKSVTYHDSIYQPIAMLNGNGELMKVETQNIKSSRAILVREACLRTNAQILDYSFAFPPSFDQEKSELLAKAKELQKRRRRRGAGGITSRISGTTTDRVALDETSERFKLVKKLIMTNYKELKPNIVTIKHDADDNTHFYARSTTGYCLNIDAPKGHIAAHGNANIYFMVTNVGVFQRCFCKCATSNGRVSKKPCSQFVSKPRDKNYTAPTIETLFGSVSRLLTRTVPGPQLYNLSIPELEQCVPPSQLDIRKSSTAPHERLSLSELIESMSSYTGHALIGDFNMTGAWLWRYATDPVGTTQDYLDAKKGKKRNRQD